MLGMQHNALLDEWMGWVYLSVCRLGMWRLKGQMIDGRGVYNAHFSQKEATITRIAALLLVLTNRYCITEGIRWHG